MTELTNNYSCFAPTLIASSNFELSSKFDSLLLTTLAEVQEKKSFL
jgi:hypothetical protein